MFDLDEQKRMLNNWRGRRYMACHAADLLEEIVKNLGEDDGSQQPPERGLPQLPPAVKYELENTVRNMKRMILAANDGNISSSKLNDY